MFHSAREVYLTIWRCSRGRAHAFAHIFGGNSPGSIRFADGHVLVMMGQDYVGGVR
jgi:hypothetical protein